MIFRTDAVLVTLVATVVTIGGIACTAPAPKQEAAPAPPDYAAQLGPIVDTFIDVWNSKEYDKLDGIMSADFRRTAPDQNAEGPAAMKAFIAQQNGDRFIFPEAPEPYGSNRHSPPRASEKADFLPLRTTPGHTRTI